MFIKMIPLYEKGNILSEKMLQVTNQYALDLSESIYQGYSDGILKGLDLDVSQEFLTISSGIVRIEGVTYLLTDSVTVKYQPVKQETALKLVFQDETRTSQFLCREAQFLLSKDLNKGNAELEICRFKLQEGARLRNDYQNYEDYNTEFDTINLIYADWSSYRGKTLAPAILEGFVKEVNDIELMNPLDQQFCQQILSAKGESLNRQYIAFYLKQRLRINVEEYDNLDIYSELKNVIVKLKTEQINETKQPSKRQRFVIS